MGWQTICATHHLRKLMARQPPLPCQAVPEPGPQGRIPGRAASATFGCHSDRGAGCVGPWPAAREGTADGLVFRVDPLSRMVDEGSWAFVRACAPGDRFDEASPPVASPDSPRAPAAPGSVGRRSQPSVRAWGVAKVARSRARMAPATSPPTERVPSPCLPNEPMVAGENEPVGRRSQRIER